ncbi:MAG: hypothetical protein Q9208_003694 [Pyrenodesmia sp. 3 TL-2023]
MAMLLKLRPMPAINVVYSARGKSTVSLQGVTGLTALRTTMTRSSDPRSETKVAFFMSLSTLMRSASVGVPLMAMYLRWTSWSTHLCSSQCLPAARKRKNAAKKIRNMQVAAYVAVVPGVHSVEKRGVDGEM